MFGIFGKRKPKPHLADGNNVVAAIGDALAHEQHRGRWYLTGCMQPIVAMHATAVTTCVACVAYRLTR